MDLLVKIISIAVLSYLLGSIPSSFIMGKLVKKIDLREHGSGNLGAANTFRVLGKGAAIPVLIFDIGKGFLAARYLPLLGGEHIIFSLIAAVLVVIGHNYSIFLKFSGGKGVGTTSGAFLALAPYAVLFCVVLWVAILLTVRIVSVASMIAAIALPIFILISNRIFESYTDIYILYLSVVVAILVLYKHRSNIKRLQQGTERRIF